MEKKIKTTIFTLMIVMASFSNLNAQAPFNWTVGGAGVASDWFQDYYVDFNRPTSTFFLSSNESVVMGRKFASTWILSDVDLYLQKLDANGNLTASFSFLQNIGYAQGIEHLTGGKAIVTSNDDIYFTGNGSEYHGGFKPYTYIAKLNSNLSLQWMKRISVVSENNIATDSYGNLYMASIAKDTSAISGKKILIRKYDGGNSDLLFSTSLKDENAGEIVSVNDFKIDNTGNSYLCGSVYKSNLAKRYLIAKLNPNGKVAWKKYYDGQSAATDDVANALALDHQNNIIVTGESFYNGKNLDIFTLKYDQNGNILWYKRKDFDNVINRGTNVQIDASNNFYVAGTDGANGSVIFKYDENGNQLWQKRFSNFTINDFQVSASGNSYVASNKNFTGTGLASAAKAHIKKLDANGHIEWVYSDPYNLNQNVSDFVRYTTNYTNIAINSNAAEVIASGYLYTVYFTPSLDYLGSFDWRNDHFSPTARTGNLSGEYNTDFNLYPNPVSNQLKFQFKDEISDAQLTILDLHGREVMNQTINSNNATINVSELKPGLYVARVVYDGNVINKKFVKE